MTSKIKTLEYNLRENSKLKQYNSGMLLKVKTTTENIDNFYFQNFSWRLPNACRTTIKAYVF